MPFLYFTVLFGFYWSSFFTLFFPLLILQCCTKPVIKVKGNLFLVLTEHHARETSNY
jgi:hypothetical protein